MKKNTQEKTGKQKITKTEEKKTDEQQRGIARKNKGEGGGDDETVYVQDREKKIIKNRPGTLDSSTETDRIERQKNYKKYTREKVTESLTNSQ